MTRLAYDWGWTLYLDILYSSPRNYRGATATNSDTSPRLGIGYPVWGINAPTNTRFGCVGAGTCAGSNCTYNRKNGITTDSDTYLDPRA